MRLLTRSELFTRMRNNLDMIADRHLTEDRTVAEIVEAIKTDLGVIE